MPASAVADMIMRLQAVAGHKPGEAVPMNARAFLHLVDCEPEGSA